MNHRFPRLEGFLGILVLPLAIVLIVLGWPVVVSAAANPVGIVLSAEPGCHVENADGARHELRKGMKLFPADVIVRPSGVSAPEVKWWPYAGWKSETAERLEVAFAPPGSGPGKGLLSRLKNFMGFVETEYEQVHGVADRSLEVQRQEVNKETFTDSGFSETEDSAKHGLSQSMDSGSPPKTYSPSRPAPSPGQGDRQDHPPLEPGRVPVLAPTLEPALEPGREPARPASGSTVLRGVVVNFVGEGGNHVGENFLITDDQGREIFSRKVDRNVILKPEEIGLLEGRNYVWRFSGESPTQARVIRLLNKPLEQQLREDFGEITRDIPDRLERKVKMAAYLQMLSDLAPTEVDLYWLSYRLLHEVQRDQVGNPVVDRYLARYHKHIRRIR